MILAIVFGVSSLIGLKGLNNVYEDYYVSAAIYRAFFTGVILFVLLSPIYFINWKVTLTERRNPWIIYTVGIILLLFLFIGAVSQI